MRRNGSPWRVHISNFSTLDVVQWTGRTRTCSGGGVGAKVCPTVGNNLTSRCKANHDHTMCETTTANNVPHRQVILGGKPGSRTVEVPPYGNVDEG
jgi:hypothetical protein